MTIRFLGIKGSQKPSGGCKVCQARKASSGMAELAKKVILPSGKAITFSAHRPVEVTETDAEYLLGLTYQYQGVETPMFARAR